MIKIIKKFKYTKDHEWVKIIRDTATIGITDYAQSELGDIIFIELPKIGNGFKHSEVIGTIEAVKTVSDLYSPINGTVIDINNVLENNPEYINNDPYGIGWIIKMKLINKNNINLLNAKEYKKII